MRLSSWRNILLPFVIILSLFYIYLFIVNLCENKTSALESVVRRRDQFISDSSSWRSNKFCYPYVKDFEKKDWHDYEFIAKEKSRKGPGEQGEPYTLTDPAEMKLNEKLFDTEGFYVIVSDKVSVNRSVPDTRDPKCKNVKYLKNLPVTSVIIIFHNEYPSTLKRTIHSVVNRTPSELLAEIILVNDASTREELRNEVPKYVEANFPMARILNLPEKKGLIVARMEGARNATGEVLVFLDSHVEVNVNWLPPLLEPIAIFPKTATTPVVDNFSHDTLKYSGGTPGRGIFDWKLVYHTLPKLPQDLVDPIKPSANPIMLGCAFAIRRDYFFDLGAYDEQFLIWNAENYELSFKLWLCGGQLLEVPCSRVAHTFRKRNKWRTMNGFDFVGHNFKRLAEVWLDEFKENFYRTDYKRYSKIDPGDLTREKKIREDLHCKPFLYMLEVVMPDMAERYPYKDVGVFARGAIISEADTKLCVDTLTKSNGERIGLFACDKNVTHPHYEQNFIFTWHRQLLITDSYDRCLDTDKVSLWGCHFALGHQLWIFNPETHQIYNPPDSCITAELSNKTLVMQKCNGDNKNQKWSFGYANETALQNWRTFGVPLPKR